MSPLGDAATVPPSVVHDCWQEVNKICARLLVGVGGPVCRLPKGVPKVYAEAMHMPEGSPLQTLWQTLYSISWKSTLRQHAG